MRGDYAVYAGCTMTKDTLLEMAELIASMRRDIDAVASKSVALEAERNELAAHVSAHVDALKQSNAQCGEYLRHNEMLAADRATLHKELVEVRAALASATEQRDSLRRTLDEWERADTKPHARIDEVAQTVPVCMQCLKERIKTAHAYETGPAVAILTKPLLPADVADHVVPPVLPMCTTCHGCGMPLGKSAKGPYYWCQNFQCTKKTTQYQDCDASPYWGPCNSKTLVRHE